MNTFLDKIGSWRQKKVNNSPDVQSALRDIHDSLMSAFEQKWAIRGKDDDLSYRLDLAYVMKPIEEPRFFEPPKLEKKAPCDYQVHVGPELVDITLGYDNGPVLNLHSGPGLWSKGVLLMRQGDRFYLKYGGLHVSVDKIPQIVQEYVSNVIHPVEGDQIREQNVSVIF